MKEDRQDVDIQCFGYGKGCLVNHCNIAKYCIMKQTELMKDIEDENKRLDRSNL